MQQAKLTNL